MKYLNELLNILNAMSPYLLLGFFIAGLIHTYTPKRAFNKYLSKKGLKSVSLSALFGIPLPLCSCGVIPTAMSLKKDGATDGATISFLISTPQTGVDSIFATYGVLGLPFAIIRPIVALIVGIAGGLIVDLFTKSKDSSTQVDETSYCNTSATTKKLTFADTIKYSFIDMIQDFGGWLTIGLIVAAAITAFVPSSIFEVLSDHYALNILVVLLLSIPMYICSTGSIPIALSLIAKGISPGAALIFLMAGPATNIATLAVVKKVLGNRTTILYLLSIILGAIGFAVLIDFALPAEWFTLKFSTISTSAHCNEGAMWWQTASSILFVVLLINAYILKFRRKESSQEVASGTTHRFKVSGMRCNHCKANIEKAIIAIPNVTSVTIELVEGTVVVEGNILPKDVCSAVEQLGFEIESY